MGGAVAADMMAFQQWTEGRRFLHIPASRHEGTSVSMRQGAKIG